MENVLKTSIADTAKITVFNTLALRLKNSNPDTAVFYANQALALAIQLDNKFEIANSYMRIAESKYNLGNFGEAIKYTDDAIVIYDYLLIPEKFFDKTIVVKKKARAIVLKGNIFFIQGNFPAAIQMNLKSLKIFEELKDWEGVAAIRANMGSIYSVERKYTEALKFLLLSLNKYKEIGSKGGVSMCYSNIGNVFYEQNKFTEAIKNYLSALKLNEETGDKKGMASCYQNLGNAYSKLERYEEAFKNELVALRLSEEIDDKHGIASISGNLGNSYLHQKKYKESLASYNRAMTISKEIGALEIIQQTYLGLSELDSAMGNFGQAYQHYKNYILYRDSLFNKENSEKIIQSQVQFEFDKKEALVKAGNEKKEAIAKQQLQKQKILRNSIIAGTALLVIFFGLFFNRYQLSKKIEKQEAILKERRRIGSDMHDDLASGLTSIRMLSEIAKGKSNGQKTDEIDKISQSAETLMENMREIIWALNTENNKLEDLVFYIRKYAGEFLDICSIEYRFDIPESIPSVFLSAEKKRNIFLSVKESLHNIAKHAGATLVTLHFNFDKGIHITITDNGKGIEASKPESSGHGLKNMKSRMEAINGFFRTKFESGTVIELSCPITEKG